MISVDDIRKFGGALTKGYQKIFITTHFYTQFSIEEAKQYGIELIGKEGLFRLIGQLQPQYFTKKIWRSR